MTFDPLDAEQVHARLAEFRRADPKFEVFGAEEHRYTLDPPLPEEEVRALERRFGITLPADYRQFVTQVGDGGAGPGDGLAPLAELFGPRVHPARPFHPPTTYEAYADEDTTGKVATSDGVLFLCDHGCSLYDGLVVSGPEAGHMFHVNDWGWRPLVPDYAQLLREELNDEERAWRRVYADFGGWPRHTFTSWYAEWLQGGHPERWFEAERQRVAEFRRRRDTPPLMPPVSVLAATLASGEATSGERIRAVRDLGRIGEPETVLPLIVALRDGDGGVRLFAMQALGKLGPLARPALPALTDLARAELLAPETDLGAATNALGALARIDPRAALPLLVEATRHPRPMLRFRAVEMLKEDGGAAALPALRDLTDDETMPRENHTWTTISVGEGARRAIAAIEARLP